MRHEAEIALDENRPRFLVPVRQAFQAGFLLPG
jgi:hypothetical protein